MGKLSRGILGGFQGTTGTVYGCLWRMLDVIRAKPRRVKRPPTELQAEVYMKMGLVTGVLAWLKAVINIGYKDTLKPTSPMNAAVKDNLESMITGTYPNLSLNYAKLSFSKGKLFTADEAGIVAAEEAELKFNWQLPDEHADNFDPADKVTIVVINPLKNRFVTVRDVVPRSALTYTLSLPSAFSGDSVHCYISFVSADKKMVSNNMYLGNIPVL